MTMCMFGGQISASACGHCRSEVRVVAEAWRQTAGGLRRGSRHGSGRNTSRCRREATERHSLEEMAEEDGAATGGAELDVWRAHLTLF
jgi:hypothetical protein